MATNMVCPFLDRNPRFAYGVEFGLLYARMQLHSEIRDYFCLANQEQILLLVNRMGWQVLEMEDHDGEWFFCHISKKGEFSSVY